MQLILDHLNNVVRPAIRAYVGAEEAFDAANRSGDAEIIQGRIPKNLAPDRRCRTKYAPYGRPRQSSTNAGKSMGFMR
jgi:hypothetical protein